MKLMQRILAAGLSLALLAPAGAQAANSEEEMRGVWVSSVYNLDYPTKKTVSADELKQQANQILDGCEQAGLNTVFLQVRPTSDALYDSDIFPWSHWLTGTQGTAPEDGFDPLEYWVDEAHRRGLELHAWINPYRVTRDQNWEHLDPSNPAKTHSGWAVPYKDGNYYYDPGLPEVRELVVDGAAEIAENYDVDGIHLDDYFYPGADFNDAATYQKYGKGFDNLADWRRDNVNQLIAALDEELHEIDPEIQFGVSPSGIWANKTTDPRGSDTRGYESYASAYADSLAWMEAGTVDYIIPQIYWEIGHSAADFATLTDWWISKTDGTDVKLYIGLAAYKCHDSSTPTWTTTKPIFDSLEYLAARPAVDGAVFFRYGSLNAVPGLREEIVAWYGADHAPENAFQSPEQAVTFAGMFSMFLTALLR